MKDHAVIVLRDGDKILFVQRSKKKKTLPEMWAFPSGTVEDGESIEATIIREAREEIGLDVSVGDTFAIRELHEFGARLHFVFCASAGGKATIQELDEIQALRWLTFREFFEEYSDDQIGHGLVWLRNNPRVWENSFSSPETKDIKTLSG